MNDNNNGAAIIIGATLLGLSILGAAYMLGQSIDAATQQLSAMQAAIAKIPSNTAGRAAPTTPPRRGPDPEKVYELSIEESPASGEADAKIQIVEFSDFQCPYCSRVTPTLAQIKQTYGEDVNIVFKHLPLPFHQKAMPAHIASEAAHNQGKFWEMHDKIFANQREMSEANYVKWAEELGLDVEQFKKDVASPELAKRIERDLAEARELGVTGTPGFFINGKFSSGAKPFSYFKQRIDEELGQG